MPPKPMNTLSVDFPASVDQKPMDFLVPPARMLGLEPTKLLYEGLVLLRTGRLVAKHRAADADGLAGHALADAELVDDVLYGVALALGA